MDRYTIKEFSKMMGLSVDTIRHYEDVGIINPIRDEKNNYRYYTHMHTREASRCKVLRSMGFSISEIQLIITSQSNTVLNNMLEKRIDDIQQEIEFLKIKLQKIKGYQKIVKTVDSKLNEIEIIELPAFLRLSHSQNYNFSTDDNITNNVKKWVDLLPLTILSRRLKKDILIDNSMKFEYDMGLLVEEKIAKKLGIIADEKTEKIKKTTYIATVIKKKEDEEFDYIHIKQILDYIKDKKIEINGDAISLFISTIKQGEITYNYHNICIPVTAKSKQN